MIKLVKITRIFRFKILMTQFNNNNNKNNNNKYIVKIITINNK